jgi:large subunit ribosomal protein L13
MKDWKDRKVLKFDCTGLSLGEAAQRVVCLVRNKDNISFDPCNIWESAPLIYCENIKKVNMNSPYRKCYKHSGYPGGLKVRFAKDLLETNPIFLFKKACRGQMPKTREGRRLLSLIRVI